jgi:hypothetical protein
MQALEFGGIFAAAMILLDAIRDLKGATRLPNLFATAMSSFAVGMLWAFGWRVFRGGIALLFWGDTFSGIWRCTCCSSCALQKRLKQF